MNRPLLSSLKLVGIYILAGGLWIALSDLALLELVGGDSARLARLQSYKGLAFVVFTALLLFLLSYHYLRRISRLQELDPQTNLLRHTLFLTHLDDVLGRSPAPLRQVLVLFLDIDDFNDLTSRIGRSAADDFIVRLGETLRRSHSAQTLLSRLGTDEFALAVPLQGSEHTSHRLHATHLHKLFKQAAGNSDLELTCSIGAAVAPADADNASDLVAAAGRALRTGRQLGPGRISYFNEKLERQEKARQSLLQDLRRAIDNGDLDVHYQPQIHLGQERLSGCEALVRWNRPGHGPVSPEIFIPLAEERGLIEPITAQVLYKTRCELNHAGLLGSAVPRVSVNISAQEFTARGFLRQINRVLEANQGLLPYLQLEITERSALYDIDRSIIHLSTLREQGLRFSIDDFGTGYSGLSMLRDLPVDELKIDRSFVVDLTTRERSAAIVHSITRLADNFRLTVVAEGVETFEQLDALRQCHCTEVQGHLIAPALCIGDFTAFLQRPSLLPRPAGAR